MKKIRVRHSISNPLVFITDYSKEIREIIRVVYLNSQLQLYIYYIIKNMLLNAKQKIVKNKELNLDNKAEQEWDNNDKGIIITVDDNVKLVKL